MFGSVCLEVTVSLVFIYLLVSLICSALSERISKLLSLRSKMLKKWIENFLNNDKTKTKNFYDHYLIKDLKKSFGLLTKVDSIPPDMFAKVLLDISETKKPIIFSEGLSNQLNMTTIEKNNIIIRSEENCQIIEKYFSTAMERISILYKKRIKIGLFILSCFVCAILNIDTINILEKLSMYSELRATISDTATKYTNTQTTDNDSKDTNIEIEKKLQEFSLNIAWDGIELPKGKSLFLKIIGILITSIAVSLGAPFWFDLLNKTINLKSTNNQT